MIVCSRLTDRLRSTVFKSAREDGQNRGRIPIEGTSVVQYGHVVHVRYDFDWKELNVFVLPSRFSPGTVSQVVK